jgi:hypothetical protein
MHLSLGASFGLLMTLLLLSGGTEVSLAQISLSPTCAIIDPLTGLCETVTSILSPPPSPTSTSTSTSTPTATTTSTAAPTGSSTSDSTGSSSSTSGETTTSSGSGTGTSGSDPLGSSGAFGYSAYAAEARLSGAYGGNFGGGTTYFAPGAQTTASRQVYFQSAFGTPVSQEVATAAVDPASIEAAPVASAINQLPRAIVLLFPIGFALLVLVTSLVLEVNEGGAGLGSVLSVRRET